MKWWNFLVNWTKLLIGDFMKPGSSGSAAGKFSSKKLVKIRKEVEVDGDGNEIAGTCAYTVIDSNGNVLKESGSLKEIFAWLDERVLELTLG